MADPVRTRCGPHVGEVDHVGVRDRARLTFFDVTAEVTSAVAETQFDDDRRYDDTTRELVDELDRCQMHRCWDHERVSSVASHLRVDARYQLGPFTGFNPCGDP